MAREQEQEQTQTTAVERPSVRSIVLPHILTATAANPPLTNEEICEIVLAEQPDRKTTPASVASIRSTEKQKRPDGDVVTAREIKDARSRLAAEAAKAVAEAEAPMDSSEMLANRRRELTEGKNKLEREISALRKEVAEMDLELGAIAAYEEHMAGRTRALDMQVKVGLGGEVTQEAVLAMIGAEVGRSRGEIISALGVKGNKSGEIAVDNRLRELKRKGSILHEERRYRTAP